MSTRPTLLSSTTDVLAPPTCALTTGCSPLAAHSRAERRAPAASSSPTPRDSSSFREATTAWAVGRTLVCTWVHRRCCVRLRLETLHLIAFPPLLYPSQVRCCSCAGRRRWSFPLDRRAAARQPRNRVLFTCMPLTTCHVGSGKTTTGQRASQMHAWTVCTCTTQGMPLPSLTGALGWQRDSPRTHWHSWSEIGSSQASGATARGCGRPRGKPTLSAARHCRARPPMGSSASSTPATRRWAGGRT